MSQETVLQRKVCNALIDTDVNLALPQNLGLPNMPLIVLILKGFKKFYGGLWVGGVSELTQTHISFVPNEVNKMLHKEKCTWDIPLKEVIDVTFESGLLTNIVCIATKSETIKLRCFGAKQYINQILEQKRV